MKDSKKPGKKERLQALKSIIEKQPIANQVTLQQELKRAGIRVTQATISRDLQELRMVKVSAGPGVHQYKVLDKAQKGLSQEHLHRIFREFVTEIISTGNLMLIKTSLGNASSVAVAIDQGQFQQLLGTVAGDDTILIVTADPKCRGQLEAEFRKLMT